jgi:hypothetical protein
LAVAALAKVVADSEFRRVRFGAGRLLVMLLAVILGLISLFVSTRPVWAAALSSAPDATVQTDGKVQAVLLVGNRIYFGGTFKNVIQDGVSVPRKRLAAIDADTGRLADWKPRPNSGVLALAASPDGSRIYVAGAFTAIGQNTRNHLAAINADDGSRGAGKVIQGWDPSANDTVFSLATLGSRVYFGGKFTNVDGSSRSQLAAVDAGTGELDPMWNPSPDGNVRTLVPAPDGSRIYTGGMFASISGEPIKKLAALDPITSTPDAAFRPNPCYPVLDLDVTSAAVYVAGGGTPAGCGGGGFAEAFDASTGTSLWRISADGDFQAVELIDGTAYYGGHYLRIPWTPDDTGEKFVRFNAVDAVTGELDRTWKPGADGGGVWSMVKDPARGRMYMGGAFTAINDQPQQGFTQFSKQIQ